MLFLLYVSDVPFFCLTNQTYNLWIYECPNVIFQFENTSRKRKLSSQSQSSSSNNNNLSLTQNTPTMSPSLSIISPLKPESTTTLIPPYTTDLRRFQWRRNASPPLQVSTKSIGPCMLPSPPLLILFLSFTLMPWIIRSFLFMLVNVTLLYETHQISISLLNFFFFWIIYLFFKNVIFI